MKALLLYITGTYHTRYLSSLLSDRLHTLGYEIIDTFEVDYQSKPFDLSSYDLICLGYPIHAFNAPFLFERFLKKLSFPKKATYLIYKQSGESLPLNNASSRNIKKILKRQGCHLHNEYHFLLPYNIHFRFEDAFVKELLHYDHLLLDILAYELSHHIESVISPTLFERINSWFFAIEKICGFVNGPLFKVDKKKCNHCLTCLKNCPMQNIVLKKDRLCFKRKCLTCMRCVFYCPKDAISIGILNGWKVNGRYPFKEIENNKDLKLPYIKGNEKGFYKCYSPTFTAIKKKHSEYFSD